MVRSEEAVRLDLLRWGASYDPNTKRPYFEGHESQDVVAQRKNFVNYFIERKSHYYSLSESNPPEWINPTEKPSILFFHDESTFRSGEQVSKRWIFNNSAPFLNKGRGKSNMIYDLTIHIAACLVYTKPQTFKVNI